MLPMPPPKERSEREDVFGRLSYEVSPMENLKSAILSLPNIEATSPICDITAAIRLMALANDIEGLRDLAKVAGELVGAHSACLQNILTEDLNVGDGDDIHRLLDKMRKSVQAVDQGEG